MTGRQAIGGLHGNTVAFAVDHLRHVPATGLGRTKPQRGARLQRTGQVGHRNLDMHDGVHRSTTSLQMMRRVIAFHCPRVSSDGYALRTLSLAC